MATPADQLFGPTLGVLDQFSLGTEQALTVEDFNVPRPPYIPDDSSVDNRAAYVSSLTDDRVSMFDQIQQEYKGSGQSPTEKEIVDGNVASSRQDLKDQLIPILVDPNVSREEKLGLAEEYGFSVDNRNPRELSAENMILNAQSTVNNESEAVSNDNIDLLAKINQADREQHELLQGFLAVHAPSDEQAETFFEAAITILPFVEGIETAKITSEFREILGLEAEPTSDFFRALLFRGNLKQEMIDSLPNVPVHKRAEVMEKFLAAVASKEGTPLIDDNDFLAVVNATDYLEAGNYTDLFRWMDNAVGILDLIGVGSGIKRLTRLGKRTLNTTPDPTITTDAGRPSPFLQPDVEEFAGPPRPFTREEFVGPPTATEAELKRTADERLLLDIERDLSSRTQFVIRDSDARSAKSRIHEIDKELDALREQRKGAKGKELSDTNTKINDLRTEAGVLEKRIKLGDEAKQAEKDLAGIKSGKLPGWVQTELAQGRTISAEDFVADAINAIIRSDVNPTSVMNMASQYDPALARNLHAALALMGNINPRGVRTITGAAPSTSIANNLMPAVNSVSGAERVLKAQMDSIANQGLDIPIELVEYAGRTSGLLFTQGEKIASRTNVYNDFQSATGLTTVENSVKIGDDLGGSFIIEGLYKANRDTGFKNAKDAIDTAVMAFKSYGVKPPEIDVLFKATDGSYAKVVGRAEDLSDGEYAIKVTHKYDRSIADVIKGDENGELLATNWQLFDRIWAFAGSPGPDRFIVGPKAIFNSQVTEGAIGTEQRGAKLSSVLLRHVKDFNKAFKKLPKARRTAFNEYTRQANDQGINLFSDINKQVRDGFSPEEIQLLRDWKSMWDQHFFLENDIYVKNKIVRGFELIESPTGDLKVLGKPIKDQRQVPENVRIYDPIADDSVLLSRDEINDLYDAGGSVSTLDHPMPLTTVGGKPGGTITLIKLDNTSGPYFGRKLRPDDFILNYRHGFYHKEYKTPFIIKREITDAAGNVQYEKAVALAGTVGDAELAVKRLTDTTGFKHRKVEDRSQKSVIGSDDAYDIAVANGRTAHKFRGKGLEDSVGRSDLDDSFIVDPIESAVKSAQSVSRATATRPWIEGMKFKAMSEFSDFLPIEKGQKRYPKSLSELRMGDVGQEKRFTDAKRIFHYIDYMEFNAAQGVDDFIAAAFKRVANIAGNASIKALDDGSLKIDKRMQLVERGLRFASNNIAPTALVRNLAFQTKIALNPIRQFTVNTHQIVAGVAIDPVYMATKAAPDNAALKLFDLASVTRGDKSKIFLGAAKKFNKDIEEMGKQWDNSGLKQSINHAELIDGSYNQLGDFLKLKSPILKNLINLPKKLGFDAGEYNLLQANWLLFRSRALKAGKSLDDLDVQESIAAQAREFSLSQSKATSFQYNKGLTGTVLQFLSTPHRAMIQMIATQGLTRTQRTSLAAFNVVTYGVPVTFALSLTGILEDVPEPLRNTITWGLESQIINSLMEVLTGEDVELDTATSLSPASLGGWNKLIGNILTTPLGEQLTNTPGISQFAGHNPVITDALKDIAKILTVDPEQRPEQAKQAILSTFNIASGYSSAFKANYATNKFKKLSSSGRISDPDVSSPEAIFALANIGTQTETLSNQYFTAMSKDYGKSSEFEQDVRDYVNDYFRSAAKKGISREDFDINRQMRRDSWEAFDINRPRAMAIINREIRNNVGGFVPRFFSSIRNQIGIKPTDEIHELINIAPIPEQNKILLRDSANAHAEFIEEQNARLGIIQ